LLDLSSAGIASGFARKIIWRFGEDERSVAQLPINRGTSGGNNWWRKVFSRSALKSKSHRLKSVPPKAIGSILTCGAREEWRAALSYLRGSDFRFAEYQVWGLGDVFFVAHGAAKGHAGAAHTWRIVFVGGYAAGGRRQFAGVTIGGAAVSAKPVPGELALSTGARVADRAA